ALAAGCGRERRGIHVVGNAEGSLGPFEADVRANAIAVAIPSAEIEYCVHLGFVMARIEDKSCGSTEHYLGSGSLALIESGSVKDHVFVQVERAAEIAVETAMDGVGAALESFNRCADVIGRAADISGSMLAHAAGIHQAGIEVGIGKVFVLE